MEDELRDPKNFVEYFLPRPLRLAFFGGSAASCLIATLLSVTRVASEGVGAARADGSLTNVFVNAAGLAVFAALFVYDQKQAEQRVEQRARLRKAQIEFGDREVFYNEEGEKMSKLKEVDDDWILRRLDRWGRRDNMPFLGPDKSAILQGIVRDAAPCTVLEVGSMCGYSALKMAQALPAGGRIIGIERDWKWFLVAKRFLWQASQGPQNAALRAAGGTPIGDRVDLRLGDARDVLAALPRDTRIDLLFLDGTPRESLEYLRAAEPLLAAGATVVADNAGVFKDGGMKAYLEHVRGCGRYNSRFVESYFEWREDVPDGLEVSVYRGPADGEAVSRGGAAAAAGQR